MAAKPALSKAEMEVARIVWDLGRATVRDVCEVLSATRSVEYKTIQTFLRRLETKGCLKAERIDRSIVYSPRTRPQKVIRDAVADFVNRLFGGEALPLLEHVIQEQGLSPDELRQLRKMLDKSQEAGAE
ncbi:BlaI/MecI/CopY family transcriptional regulator [Schlesneria paludicola]|uniref:BlaI/MecI/CopY family transcriptional regulator n=1 Tax=Schlesneria paludicola TaxID=360056 RepID=UPI000299FB22|nr:BlaI/MecI/CopY family transcriptional regulator [Schlesneria paludicola]